MAYKISEENLERQKLLGKAYGPFLDKLIDSIDQPLGNRCLDLGCGIGGSTRSIASRLGNSSELVGVDVDPGLIDAARKISAEQGLAITFQQGDANELEFEDQSFDSVFARSLLMHMSDPEKTISEMLRVCKPGGVVAVQEGDLETVYCYPRSWAYEKLPELYSKLVQDPLIGRKLWALFHELGYSSVNVAVDPILELEGNEFKRYTRLSFESIIPALIENGFAKEEECRKICEELRRVEQTDGVLCMNHLFYSAWVTRS